MKKILNLIGLLAIFFLVGCAQITIRGSGNVVTQEENLSGFDQVDISHEFSMKITQGDEFSVVMRVDDNLVEHLEVIKQGSKLIIQLVPNRAYNIINATMQAEVTMPELVGLDISGSSDVQVSGFESSQPMVVDASGNSTLRGDIKAGNTSLDVSGNSSIALSGSAGDLRVSASGSSEVDLGDFPASDGSVDASGASTVTVNLSGRLDADASGSSDIYYLGDPELGSIDTSGSSSVQSR